jgi:hypothetical protein
MGIKSFLKAISTLRKDTVKSLFQEDFGKKEVELIVNGLTKKLSPELQTTLILSLINYRNKEIQDTQNHLETLILDKNRLTSTITENNTK